MRFLLLIFLFPFSVFADTSFVFTPPEHFTSLYQFHVYHSDVDLSVPLCKQPDYLQYSYVDERCYAEIPFDTFPCYEWSCPVPYDHVFYEPLTGTTKVIRDSADIIDQHYRSVRSMLLAPQSRTTAPVKRKKKR